MKIHRLIVLALFLFPALASAQQPDPAKTLGLSPMSGSMPFWVKPSSDARTELGKVVRAGERGVFIAGSAETAHGTAWVISKKHRLLVTNAHVADLFHEGKGKMFAIPNGTSQLYRVEKVYYHPGVRRYLKENPTLSVRSTDPKKGDIDPFSPDLAVLQLSTEGPELTVEFAPAGPDELATLFAQPAAIFGFPGHDTKDWPKLGATIAATYHDGTISRITDFEMNPSSPPGELQFVQYSMSTWGGFSGSPILLPSGRVAAVHNMARYARRQVSEKAQHVMSIPHGIRVDCVMEMLVHHGLETKVPFEIDKTKVLVERWLKPDARTEKARADMVRAYKLIRAADLLDEKGDHLGCIQKCDEAQKLTPNLPAIYRIRSAALQGCWYSRVNQLKKDTALKLLELAKQDVLKLIQLEPSDPTHVIHFCRVEMSIAQEFNDQSIYRKPLAILNELLKSDKLEHFVRSDALGLRAGAHEYLGMDDLALRDHDEAVRLSPNAPCFLEGRGQFHKNQGRLELADADFAKAKELRRNRGMKIIELVEDGPAKKGKLRIDDIIIEVDDKRVTTFAELSAALAEAKGPVKIVFVNNSNQRESVIVTPIDGKIGITVAPVPLK